MEVILPSILTSAKRDYVSALNITVEYFEILDINDLPACDRFSVH